MGPIHQLLGAAVLAILLLPAGSSVQEKGPKAKTKATVTDSKGKSITIADPRCVTKTSGLFGESEEIFQHFIVYHGEGTLKIPFADIKSFTVKKVEGERIRVEIEHRKVKEGSPPKREYLMKNDELIFRGDSEYGQYEISLVVVKTITFVEEKKPESGG